MRCRMLLIWRNLAGSNLSNEHLGVFSLGDAATRTLEVQEPRQKVSKSTTDDKEDAAAATAADSIPALDLPKPFAWQATILGCCRCCARGRLRGKLVIAVGDFRVFVVNEGNAILSCSLAQPWQATKESVWQAATKMPATSRHFLERIAYI